MKIYEIKERNTELMRILLDVWETSVRETHHFLSDTEINQIKKYVPQALNGVEHLMAAVDEESKITGFMGV